MAKEAFDQFSDFNKLTAEISKRTTEYVLSTFNELMLDTNKNLSELSRVKEMKDLFAAQTRFITDCSNKMMKSSQEALSVWKENANDITQFMEHCSRGISAMSPLKPTAEKKAAA